MHLLWLSKISQPDLLPHLSYLTTRVHEPNLHYCKKLAKAWKYLHSTRHLPLTLKDDNLLSINWNIDVAFLVHHDIRSHTGIMAKLGKGCVYGATVKQKISTKSSMEAELVGVRNSLPQVIWSRNFIEAQGYNVKESVLYQYKQSTIRLCINGQGWSGKRARHINLCYLFITNHIKSKEVTIKYCPTKKMIADFFRKPLQGSKFIKFRHLILNIQKWVFIFIFLYPINYLITLLIYPESQECVGNICLQHYIYIRVTQGVRTLFYVQLRLGVNPWWTELF